MEQQVKDNTFTSNIVSFDPTKKKKKKKKKRVRGQPINGFLHVDPLDKLTEITSNLLVPDRVGNEPFGFEKIDYKLAEVDVFEDENVDTADYLYDEDEEGGDTVISRYPWEGTERDYQYEELLGRVFNLLRENNPELAGDRRRTVMRPPQVLEGTAKTVFLNFMDLCKTMHRQPEHVMTFLLAGMGTSGSLDGQLRLVVKGRFAPKDFEGILRRYINEYVICHICKGPDTILTKENHLFFLRCEQCGSGRPVAPIKAGFVARVDRRKIGT